MKTRIIIAGVIVAIASAFSIRQAKAQQATEPAIKIVPAFQKDMVKLIYAYPALNRVQVKFLSANGVIKSDIINGKEFANGFIKKYDLSNVDENILSVEIATKELTATYQLKEKNGKWSGELEKATYNYPSVALN